VKAKEPPIPKGKVGISFAFRFLSMFNLEFADRVSGPIFDPSIGSFSERVPKILFYEEI
jgi:hypothetical protein